MTSVLVVEDEPAVLRAITRVLQHEGGFEVFTAKDATQALKLLEGRTFDLVLLDLVLPDGAGFEVLDRMRPPRPMVVAMTASTGIVNRAVAMARGCAGFLDKPFTMDSILSEIRRVLAHRAPG